MIFEFCLVVLKKKVCLLNRAGIEKQRSMKNVFELL